MISHKPQLYFLFLLLAAALVLSFFILVPFFAPLTMAAIFAVIFYPLYTKIVFELGNRKAVGALITVLLAAVFILLPLGFLGVRIFQEVAQVYTSATQDGNGQNFVGSAVGNTEKFLENFLPGSRNFIVTLFSNMDTYVRQGITWLINHVGVALSSITTLMLDLFIFFISFYYFLRDGIRLKQAIVKLSPLDDADDKIIFERLSAAINSVVKGSLLIALIQGILTSIGFTIFGIPNAVLWGAITVIAALIPGIGTSLVILPAVVYLFIIGNPLNGFGLLLWGMFAVGLIDNTLYPKLVGRNLQMHPLVVLLAVLGGIALFGPIGIFLGPITLSLLFALFSIYTYFSDSKLKGRL